MRTPIIKKREREEINWTNSFFILVLALSIVCGILLMSSKAKASSLTIDDMVLPQTYGDMNGQTELGVDYETVYIGNSKFIVFKYSNDIEVVRAN